MMGKDLVAVWKRALGIATGRPAPFLAASALLACTGMMLWKMGAYDDATRADLDPRTVALFVAAKLVLLFGWALLSLRLIHDPSRPLGRALRIDGRQALWIGGLFVAVPAMLALRIGLARGAAAAVPAGSDPRTAALVAALLYLAVSLILIVRIVPGWVGVMVGDREAGLGWSWRASRGRALRSIALVFAAVLPVGALHFALNLFWMAEAAPLRAAILVADGGVMAFYVAVAAAAYATLYDRARASSAGSLSPVHA